MKIDSSHLADLMVEIANEYFGAETFTRRQLLSATEQILREHGLWTRKDDQPSSSMDSKPRGRVEIESCFADLERWRVLLARQPNCWRLATPKVVKYAEMTPRPARSASTASLPACFEHREAFVDYLQVSGIAPSARTYVSWINSAARRLGLSLGPSHLSCDDDVERLVKALHSIDRRTRGALFIKKPGMETNLRSALRKYAQMVQSNFRGLFKHAPRSSRGWRTTPEWTKTQRQPITRLAVAP
jgi:hypothetical protein